MSEKNGDRREFLRTTLRGTAGVVLAGVGGIGLYRSRAAETMWQIDPALCTQCGQCATHCVKSPSAVKCVHAYAMCGYCKLCSGFFRPNARLDTGAENQLCPTGALKRRFVEEPFFEYTIDESLCIGCGRCVKGCGAFGNGSLFLQVRQDLCDGCNECAIARACPSRAFKRVPIHDPYILKQAGKTPGPEEG